VPAWTNKRRDEALLQKYGLKANDAILAEEKHMGLYDELFAKDAKLLAGGAAQNSARGAQVCEHMA
jgi:adenosine kinase